MFSKRQISDAFNSYFSNIAVDLESKLPPPNEDFMQYMQGDYLNSIAIPETTPDDIIKIINQLKNKPCSVDDISVRVIKYNAQTLSQPPKASKLPHFHNTNTTT